MKSFYSTPIPVVEIFQSVSGEGVSAGNIVTFVRVAGCDLRCTWCDTKYSFKESGDGVELLLPEDILTKLKQIGTSEIICTGGEPLEQNKTKRYLPAYLQSKGFNVRIETSGASKLYSETELSFFELTDGNRPVYTMDLKCPASGMEHLNKFENINNLDPRDELKIVVADDNDLEYSLSYLKNHSGLLSSKRITVNYSPVFESLKPHYLVEFLKKHKNTFDKENLTVRLSLQIHKFIWPPHQRGV